MYKDFKDMQVWEKAMRIAEVIFNITSNLPRSEDYGFTSQIRRSGLSISANIAEGFGRNHPAEKTHFYYIARGSLMETLSHLEYGHRVKYISEDDSNVLSLILKEEHLELNKLIKSIKNRN
jgi:four helix bundle protein